MARVLIACEFSGIVRDAFIAKGHDAWSCDLLPSERPGPHLQCDIDDVLEDCWDMMIAFPPCTHLAVSGARWFKDKREEQEEALEFVKHLLEADIDKIALENPIGIISSRICKPDQIIHPHQFGHPEAKTTCLWLKHLPPLMLTCVGKAIYACRCGGRFTADLGKYGCPNCCGDKGAARLVYENQTISGQNRLAPSETRAKERSRTYVGIASAMADQWG